MIVTVFDTETSGLIENPARKLDSQPEIISLAIQTVDLASGEIIDPYYKEFKPLKPISADITRITGITNERLEIASSIGPELYYIIPRITGTTLILGQNIEFDKSMIEFECRRYKFDKPIWPRILDLVQHTIHLKGYRLSLTNLYLELFGTTFESAHDSAADCTATSRCAIELFKRGLL